MKLALHRRSRRLVLDRRGRRGWICVDETAEVDASGLALLVCDMWDLHWCRAASERVKEMAPRIDRVLSASRKLGALIIHAPSQTMAHYEGSPARQRALAVPPRVPPPELPHEDPPLPIDDSNGGCDSEDNPGAVNQRLWTRQHPAIFVDPDRDVVSDDGLEIYGILCAHGIRCVAVMGVHTNMCILNRSFGIKRLVRWGVDVVLCRDLTDSMYDPARPPCVDHAAGTELVVAHIESHWCPTIDSRDLLLRGPAR